MSKKTRYYIEPLLEGKVRAWIIRCNKNKKFLAEYPNAKEVSKTDHDKVIINLKNNFTDANKTNTI